ncbi:MAG TPA: hypothetical protein PKW44_04820 [Methylophilaceae bacterium]|nr:hypothetical protein [Methylophilaceae bacterium]HQR61165.1 hypothetical protein [Methylophilaceae bacterium]
MTQLEHGFSALSAADRQLIEDEHARLELFLQDLRDTCCEYETTQSCQGCGKEKAACCQGRLTSFFYDFLDLIEQHFENEENIMRRLTPAAEDGLYFIQHQQAHAGLMLKVRAAMHEAGALNKQGKTAEAIRLLYRQVPAMFGEHACRFDDAFLRAA